MKPYKNIRSEEFEPFPDLVDLRAGARKSSESGRKRGIMKNKRNKAQVRRNLKRTDKNKQREIERRDGE